ncbi:hypothetical protein EE612_005839, partial [Oryza sativa]
GISPTIITKQSQPPRTAPQVHNSLSLSSLSPPPSRSTLPPPPLPAPRASPS